MNGYLRQGTAAQARLIGPFLDDTDFKTPETALTITNTDVKLRVNGTTLVNKASGGATHQVNGFYSIAWDAIDTAAPGELAFSIAEVGALPVFGTYQVVPAASYDALFVTGILDVNVTAWRGTAMPTEHTPGYPVVTLKQGTSFGELQVTEGAVDRVGTVLGDVQGSILGQVGDLTTTAARRVWDALEAAVLVPTSMGVKVKGLTFTVANLLDVNMYRMKGNAEPVDRLDRSARALVLGTASTSTSTSIPTTSLSPPATITDQFKTRVIIFDRDTVTAALRGQATDILSSTAGGTLTVNALTTAPTAGDTFVIL